MSEFLMVFCALVLGNIVGNIIFSTITKRLHSLRGKTTIS